MAKRFEKLKAVSDLSIIENCIIDFVPEGILVRAKDGKELRIVGNTINNAGANYEEKGIRFIRGGIK